MASHDEPKLVANLENLRKEMFDAAMCGSLEPLKSVSRNTLLDDQQRKTLLNSSNDRGWTMLHFAALCQRSEIITWLLSDEGRAAGFDSILAKSNDGYTALYCAAEFGRLDCFKAIVNGCRDGEGEELLNCVGQDGRTVLHQVAHGITEMITWIMTEGVAAGFDRKNITALTKGDSFSALHLAVQANTETTQTLLSHCSDKERMNLFLCVDNDGWTALHHAARKEEEKTIAELLRYPECSLIVDMKDNSGLTVLHRAIVGGLDETSRDEWRFCFAPNSSIVRALLRSPAIDPNIGLGRQ